MSVAALGRVAVAPAAEHGASLWSDAWRRLGRNRAAVTAGVFLAVMAALTVAAPWLPGLADPTLQDLRLGAVPPSPQHWFGTDELGRDLLSRVVYGGRISMLVGLVGTLVSLVIGVTWGVVAGYAGGRVDDFMMRVVDILYALPYIFLVILLLVLFSKTLIMLFVALGLVQWLTMARIVRGQVLSLKTQTFVEAARALGAPDAAIVFRHIVPNTLGPVIVYTTLTVPAVILQEAFLSFLGLGVQPPAASWGTLVSNGSQVIALFPWLVIFPGIALSLTLLCFNFLGDGLRDALDPQDRRDVAERARRQRRRARAPGRAARSGRAVRDPGALLDRDRRRLRAQRARSGRDRVGAPGPVPEPDVLVPLPPDRRGACSGAAARPAGGDRGAAPAAGTAGARRRAAGSSGREPRVALPRVRIGARRVHAGGPCGIPDRLDRAHLAAAVPARSLDLHGVRQALARVEPAGELKLAAAAPNATPGRRFRHPGVHVRARDQLTDKAS